MISTVALGDSIKLIGAGLTTRQVHQPVLTLEQIAQLEISPEEAPFDGDPTRFRLGVEAMRLGLAYEYDPYFSLSIARVDPLPHQLEAVYDYFLKLPRIRFLLADDPARARRSWPDCCIKELKIRGLVRRTLIVTPANLSFQWQREMKDKFRESFRGHPRRRARANYGPNPWQDKDQVHHVGLLGLAHRGRQGKPAAQPLGLDHRRRGPQDERLRATTSKTLAYRLGESLSAMTDHYLLMTATPHKGDPQTLLPVPALARQGRLRRREEPGRGDAERQRPVLPAADQGGPGHLPRPRDGKCKKLFTKRDVKTADVQNRRRRVGLLRRPDPLRRGPVDQGRADDSAAGPGARLHDGDAPAPFRLQHLCRAPQPRAHEGQAREDPGRPRGLPAGADRRELPDDFDDLPDEEQQEILAELGDRSSPRSIRPRCARRSSQLGRLIDQAAGPGAARGRDQAGQAPGGPHRERRSSTTRR